jgi:hypothetical protein
VNKDDIDEIVRAHTTGAMSTHWDKCYLKHSRCALHLLANELKYAMFALDEVLENCALEYDLHEGHVASERAEYLLERYKGRLAHRLIAYPHIAPYLKEKWVKFEQEMRDQHD